VTDHPHRISRREAVAGAAAAATGAGLYVLLRGGPEQADSASDCVLTPELTEGPYYLDNHLIRRDIRGGKKGVLLTLKLGVQDAGTCKPIQGATVEIWHCDALGNYSGFNTSGNYLRGGQKTNSAGVATFKTIYPGWYEGRAVHIHVKVHVGGDVVHTGQLFFNDTTTDKVYTHSPYSSRGARTMRNSSDNIYRSGGSKSLVRLTKTTSGYVGRLTMGVRA
jgi:protocatechuate 3,4-dioxygenase beta subunit